MYCTQCGNPASPDARFCGNCGSSLGRTTARAETPTPSSPSTEPRSGAHFALFLLASVALLFFGAHGSGISLPRLLRGELPWSHPGLIATILPPVILMAIGLTRKSGWLWKLYGLFAVLATLWILGQTLGAR